MAQFDNLFDPNTVAGAQSITTPTGFFNQTIAPTFEEDIFSPENLAGEPERPDTTSMFQLRRDVERAAQDDDLGLLEFDATAGLARQKLESDLLATDAFSRQKRDLEFNISAERDVQFQQGRQLLSDIDAFIGSSRATVEQREYENEIKRQEDALKEQKKEELELQLASLGIDATGMSRKKMIKELSSFSREQLDYERAAKSGKSGYGSGGLRTVTKKVLKNTGETEDEYTTRRRNELFEAGGIDTDQMSYIFDDTSNAEQLSNADAVIAAELKNEEFKTTQTTRQSSIFSGKLTQGEKTRLRKDNLYNLVSEAKRFNEANDDESLSSAQADKLVQAAVNSGILSSEILKELEDEGLVDPDYVFSLE